jgi:hypothetical protein
MWPNVALDWCIFMRLAYTGMETELNVLLNPYIYYKSAYLSTIE